MQIDHNMEWCVVAGKLKSRVHYMQIDVRRLQDQFSLSGAFFGSYIPLCVKTSTELSVS